MWNYALSNSSNPVKAFLDSFRTINIIALEFKLNWELIFEEYNKAAEEKQMIVIQGRAMQPVTNQVLESELVDLYEGSDDGSPAKRKSMPSLLTRSSKKAKRLSLG